jgi:hypothetical protein
MQSFGRMLALGAVVHGARMHTKNGKPLQVIGNTVYAVSGHVLGRVRDAKLFAQDGSYVGTIVDDRLVFRTADSYKVAPGFTAAKCKARGLSDRARSKVRGDEPTLPQ